jgi:putative tryptophan/tyrosine transport system ATP-binding protein
MPDGCVTIDDRLLELRDVRLVYNRGKADEVNALRGVDLVAAPGEFLTVIGSNGAGKSSIVQTISGAVRPSSGSVLIGGRDVTRWPDYRRAAFVARVFDDPRVGSAPDLSIEDNLALAMSRGRRHGLRLSLTGARRRVMRDRLSRLGLGLEDRLHERVGLLSAGQRQSLTMVMAGLSAPQVLLLDEHLAALDPATAQRVLTLTAELVAEMGSTTIMITHNMEHALEMGTRLLLMSRGRILADLEHKEKTTMTTQGLVDLISRAGDVLGDRTLLSEFAEAVV